MSSGLAPPSLLRYQSSTGTSVGRIDCESEIFLLASLDQGVNQCTKQVRAGDDSYEQPVVNDWNRGDS